MPRLPPVLIRADATPAMGTGHVMRCLAVAEALAEAGALSHLAAATLTPGLDRRAAAAGVTCHRLDATAGSPADAAAVLDLAHRLGAGALILDGYHFTTPYRAVLAGGGLPVLTFDDLGDGEELHATIVVNASPHAERLPYARIAAGAERLLGPAYAPLRRDIRAAAADLPPLAERGAVLITFGGSDPLALTAPTVTTLARTLPPAVGIIAAVGGGVMDPGGVAAAVGEAAATRPGRVAMHHDTPAMGVLMRQAGLAVTAGGSTLAELAALGVPSLVVVAAGNQAPATAEAQTAGWCVAVEREGGDSRPLPLRLAEQAAALWSDRPHREAMSARAVTLLDGRGAERVAAALFRRL